MAKKASRRHGKRGLKKGHKKSAKWIAAISRGLKRAWKEGKFKNRKHGKRGHRRFANGRKRGSARYYHNIAKRFDESVKKTRAARRKKRTKYLTHDPRSGKSYF